MMYDNSSLEDRNVVIFSVASGIELAFFDRSIYAVRLDAHWEAKIDINPNPTDYHAGQPTSSSGLMRLYMGSPASSSRSRPLLISPPNVDTQPRFSAASGLRAVFLDNPGYTITTPILRGNRLRLSPLRGAPSQTLDARGVEAFSATQEEPKVQHNTLNPWCVTCGDHCASSNICAGRVPRALIYPNLQSPMISTTSSRQISAIAGRLGAIYQDSSLPVFSPSDPTRSSSQLQVCNPSQSHVAESNPRLDKFPRYSDAIPAPPCQLPWRTF
ncbi:hypothetical protein C8R43DRAFT_954843 [Mycena crocata]|nr:hypothetical protein C8R43DRAFT_954843 [Mycena crocata]